MVPVRNRIGIYPPLIECFEKMSVRKTSDLQKGYSGEAPHYRPSPCASHDELKFTGVIRWYRPAS